MNLRQIRQWVLDYHEVRRSVMWSEEALAYVLAHGGTFQDAVLKWRDRCYQVVKYNENVRILETRPIIDNKKPRSIPAPGHVIPSVREVSWALGEASRIWSETGALPAQPVHFPTPPHVFPRSLRRADQASG